MTHVHWPKLLCPKSRIEIRLQFPSHLFLLLTLFPPHFLAIPRPYPVSPFSSLPFCFSPIPLFFSPSHSIFYLALHGGLMHTLPSPAKLCVGALWPPRVRPAQNPAAKRFMVHFELTSYSDSSFAYRCNKTPPPHFSLSASYAKQGMIIGTHGVS